MVAAMIFVLSVVLLMFLVMPSVPVAVVIVPGLTGLLLSGVSIVLAAILLFHVIPLGCIHHIALTHRH